MKNVFTGILLLMLVAGQGVVSAQCNIDTTNTTTGFTPATPAVISPGVPYSQTVQVYVPATYGTYIVDSLVVDSIAGMPTGITYVFNPESGVLLGGTGGAVCYTGVTNDTVGPYPLVFYGYIYTNAGPIPFSYLSQLAPNFGYKFRVETAPVAAFTVDSPACLADSVQFVDLTTGYPTHWAWTFPGGSPATSTLEFPLVIYDTAGTYQVTLIARNSISTDTITQSITVYSSPSATVATTASFGADSAANGTAVATASGGTPPYTYLWSTGATIDTISDAVAGTYALLLTDSKGCAFSDDTINISFISGILQISPSQQVKIYPNPATDVLNLVWSQKPNAEVAIIDLEGNVLNSFAASGQTATLCNIQNLASGDYILRITDKASNVQNSMLFSKF